MASGRCWTACHPRRRACGLARIRLGWRRRSPGFSKRSASRLQPSAPRCPTISPSASSLLRGGTVVSRGRPRSRRAPPPRAVSTGDPASVERAPSPLRGRSVSRSSSTSARTRSSTATSSSTPKAGDSDSSRAASGPGSTPRRAGAPRRGAPCVATHRTQARPSASPWLRSSRLRLASRNDMPSRPAPT
jgi:hypothetical protein